MTLLTDKQAREQTCPLIRYCINEAGVIQDREAAIYVQQRCQGSDCKMGWRWAQPARFADRFGYCGAFGEPTVPS